MQQQQKESQGSTKKSNFLQQSESESESESNTLTSAHLITKLNLNKTMSSKDIKKLLVNEIFNTLISDGLKNGAINITENGTYAMGMNKDLSKQDIIKILSKNKTPQIQKLLDITFSKIQNTFDINNLNSNLIIIRNQIKTEQKTIKTLSKDREKLVKIAEKQNAELLQTLYRQSKIESQARTEVSAQEFQKQNMGVAQANLIQGAVGLKQGVQNQILNSQSQINSLLGMYASEQQHISNLQQQFANTKLQHLDNSKRNQLADDANKLSSLILNENTKLRSDTNANFSQLNANMSISAANALAASRDINASIKNAADDASAAARVTQQAIKNAAADASAAARVTQQAIKNASDAAQDLASKAASENLRGFDSLREGISKLGANVASLGDRVNEVSTGIAQVGENIGKLNTQVPVAPGVPPACQSGQLPRDCRGNSWKQTPEYRNATNKTSGQTGIEIYQCDAGGHFCSSDGHSGNWRNVSDYYYNTY